jgi:membrane associated rhomboid family serine protease
VFPLKDNIPTDRFAVVTVTLIVANVLAYFLFQHGTITLGEPANADFFDNLVRYAAVPYEITHPGQQCVPVGEAFQCGKTAQELPSTWITVFTSMFMHGGLLHLGGNMLFLWIFGNNVEDSMGPVKFSLFYVLGGVAAAAAQTVIAPNAAVPTIGASGAVAGVLGGYILLFPRARVVTVIFIIFFFTILELPAILVLGFWFLQQVAFGYFDLSDPTGGGGGVAYFAHIGGFAFGLLAVKLFADDRKRRRREPPRDELVWAR